MSHVLVALNETPKHIILFQERLKRYGFQEGVTEPSNVDTNKITVFNTLSTRFTWVLLHYDYCGGCMCANTCVSNVESLDSRWLCI